MNLKQFDERKYYVHKANGETTVIREKDMDPYELRFFYRPICSEKEIDRILSVQNNKDYLLRIRADTAIDNMRIMRVIMSTARKSEKNWSLSRFFNDRIFNQYLAKTNPDVISSAANLTYGYMFSKEPDGCCEITPFGNLITVSFALKYFVFYSNLSLYPYRIQIPPHVRFSSLIIAIRTMLQNESLDFNLDPRGIIPRNIGLLNSYLTKLQLEFIIGHEFAHNYCNHLDKNNTKSIVRYMTDNKNESTSVFYTISQKQEFEADYYAIKNCVNYAKRVELCNAAIRFFDSLYIYEEVKELMFPSDPYLVKDHPPALERKENIIEKFPNECKPFLEFDKKHTEYCKFLANKLKEDISYNIEYYEFYGSVYFDKPDTQWRGKELIDRKDY